MYIKMSSWLIMKNMTLTERESIKTNLTFYSDTGDMVEAFVERNGLLYVPRGYRFYADLDDFIKQYDLTEGEPIDISMKYSYRDLLQQKAVKSIIKNDIGIIAAQVGFGKTFVAIKSIAKLKKKALIIVHKKVLAEQWIEKIKEYTDIKDIGLIKGSSFDIDKPIVVAMIQTLISRYKRNSSETIKLMKEANFGITFFDECHITVGPGVFLNASKLIFSKRMYGLSATPYRSDGLTQVINVVLGKKIFTHEDIKIFNHILIANIPIDVGKSRGYILFGGRFNKQRYINIISKNSFYMNSIYGIINYFVKNDSYHVLILGEKKKLLDKLYSEFNSEDVGLYYAGREKDEINKRIIFATYQIFKEGIDVPKLNVIIFLTPMGSTVSVKQSLGRIYRKFEGKTDVFIIDIVNSMFDVDYFLRKKRLSVYKELKNYKIYKANMVSFDSGEEMIENFIKNAKIKMEEVKDETSVL